MADVWWYENRECWCADVPHPTEKGKRKRLYLGADKQEAKRKLHEYMAGYYADPPAKGANPPEKKEGRLSLAKLLAKFTQWAETNMAETTLDRYVYALKKFVEKHGHLAASEIDPLQAEEEKARLKRKGASPRTINYFVQSIKRLFNWGVDYGLLESNPVDRVKRVPKKPKEDKSLDDSEVETFLKYARESQPLGDFCEVLVGTGMRVSELLNLKWDQVDFEEGKARIFEHKTATRSSGSPKTIPLSSRVMSLLKEQPEVSPYIFTGRNDQQLTYHAVRSRKRYLEKRHSDMPRVTFHQFRHTFATRLARGGVPERVAQEILGHSSTMMTRYYTNTPLSEMLDAVEGLGGDSDAGEPEDQGEKD